MVPPFVRDDIDPGKVSDLALDQRAEVCGVVDRLIDDAVEGRLVVGIDATAGGDDGVIERNHAMR